jgi:hypothetical protein
VGKGFDYNAQSGSVKRNAKYSAPPCPAPMTLLFYGEWKPRRRVRDGEPPPAGGITRQKNCLPLFTYIHDCM